MEIPDLRKRFPRAAKAVLVTNSNVDPHWGDEVVRVLEASGLPIDRVVVPAGEAFERLLSARGGHYESLKG